MSLTNGALRICRIPNLAIRAAMYSNEGKSGSIVDGGGVFAEKEKAQENQYFHKLQREQLKQLKGHLEEEVSHHEAEIKRHKEQIDRLKAKTQNLEK